MKYNFRAARRSDKKVSSQVRNKKGNFENLFKSDFQNEIDATFRRLKKKKTGS